MNRYIGRNKKHIVRASKDFTYCPDCEAHVEASEFTSVSQSYCRKHFLFRANQHARRRRQGEATRRNSKKLIVQDGTPVIFCPDCDKYLAIDNFYPKACYCKVHHLERSRANRQKKRLETASELL